MADVTATCTECGAEMKVSQFADPEQVKCKECGGKLQIPEQVLRRSERFQTQQKKDADPISPLVAMHRQQQQQRSTVMAAYDVSKHTMKRRSKGSRIWVWTPNKLTLLIIFIIGTGILSALRFLPFLGDEDLAADAVGAECERVFAEVYEVGEGAYILEYGPQLAFPEGEGLAHPHLYAPDGPVLPPEVDARLRVRVRPLVCRLLHSHTIW